MKKFVVFLIIFISCGGTDVEMIEEPIETIAVSTSTLTPTTTTVTTTSTTTAVPVDYKDTIKEENFFLYFTEYRTTSYADNIFLQLRGYWNEAKSLTIYFNDDCTIFEEINYSRTNNSIGTIAINITDTFEKKEECKKSSKATSIKVKQVYEGKSADNPYLNFLENGKYFIGKINTTEEEINALCCHDIEFNVINLYISEILNTATTTTTTTTTVPKYTFPVVDFSGCPDSYSMTSSNMNLSIDYTITGGDAEIVEFTFENFDTNNGEDFSNSNKYSSEKAAESGIILPKTKGEVVGIETTFYAQNQNEKRTVKLVVTATDSNGFVGSGECKFIMNPNGEIVQATTTTTLAPTTTLASTTTTTPSSCNKRADNTPPKVLSYSISKSSVDVANKSEDFVVTLNITDDCVGVPVSEILITFGDTGFAYNRNRVSGNSLDGIYEIIITVPEGHKIGNFEVLLFPVDDENGNTYVPSGQVNGFITLGYVDVK